MKKILFLVCLTPVLIFLTGLELCFAEEISADGLDAVYNSSVENAEWFENPLYFNGVYQDNEACRAELKSFRFESGDIFELYNYYFKSGNNQGSAVKNGFSIPGSSIEIHYYDYQSKSWSTLTNTENLPKETLFIDTDSYHMVIGVPTVYANYSETHTAVIFGGLEKPVEIVKSADEKHYDIKYTFNSSGLYDGSVWVLKSERPLVDWDSPNQLNIINSDLVHQGRFLWDGYYFTQSSDYSPYYGSGTYCRHPSSYVPVVFAHYGSFNAAYDLGYAFTYICMKNQCENGYWKTGQSVNWLNSDFGIGGGFYDTRFNTDFAQGLLYAYKRYGNPEFLDSLIKYIRYFFSHAENYHYETENGGLLVQDYSCDYDHKNTHCSLNHQLAELNLLYNVYDEIKFEGCRLLADKMLLGVEDTCDQWILENNNLKYALYYSGSANTMTDYPYLTYNDLFTTRQILRDMFNRESEAVNRLMDAKLKWMKANNVTGYYQN
ncbi:MAG: hypothetical protein LUD81_00130 [Clostridiales bacterium]|nr:hypothetical protein [Clostridiales bacterium]